MASRLKRPPVMGVCRSPLIPLRPEDMHEVPVGVTIASLQPEPLGVLLCRVNGDWLLREGWESLTRPGDVIEWHDTPLDREGGRELLSTLAVVLSIIPGGQALAGYAYAAAAAYNLLVPPQVRTLVSPQQTEDVLGTSLSGNVARIDQAIWKVCGRCEISPPFASQPYQEFLPREDSDDPELDREQYYSALLAISEGDNNIVGVKIANTPKSRFKDILIAAYLAPGVQPSMVLANVVTAVEVSSQVLEPGFYVGGFAACAPLRTVRAIGIDVTATRGLGATADPDIDFDGTLTVNWRVEKRPINDFGQVLGPWVSIASESRTGFTATPQRWSNTYELDTVERVEIRVVRTNPQYPDPQAQDEIAWIGLRAYLDEPAPLNEHVCHYEIVLRASSQLSNVASHDIRLIVEAKTRTLNADLEWQTATHTRNPAWWLLELATSTTWGMGKPDTRVDLQSFYDLAQICEARQDRFDFTFDTTMNAWDAMQLIARSCRSRVFRRNGVISVARDQLADVPVTAFTPRNCQAGMQISERLPQRDSPDGFVIEYRDYRSNEWKEIDCPCPGVTEMLNPVHMRLEGVVGPTQAEREGLYEAFNHVYRPRTVVCTTGDQGMLPAYMSPVDFLADLQGYGSSGDVAFWDEDTLVMGLTEPPDWSQAPLYLTLIRDDGSRTDDVEVQPGSTANEVVLPYAPDFELILDDGTRERPMYLIGRKDLVKITSIADGGMTDDGAQLYALTGVIDDDRVHMADVHLLPGPGDIQDPVGNPDDIGDGDGDLLYIAYLTNHTATDSYIIGGDIGPVVLRAAITLGSDGLVFLEGLSDRGTDPTTIPNEWILHGEAETSVTSQFESRATLLSSASANGDEVFTGTLDTWVPMPATWALERTSVGDFENIPTTRRLLIEIRVIGDVVIQASGIVTLTVISTTSGPGGE